MTAQLSGELSALGMPNSPDIAIDAENAPVHREWDDFLTGAPGGDITQTAAWARFKQASGLEVHRLVLRAGGRITAGAQLLARRLGAIGAVAYLPYGPVVGANTPDGSVSLLAARLVDWCRRQRIRALFVQPPDGGEPVAAALRAGGFRPSDVHAATTASLRLDARLEPDELLAAMSRHARADVRRSLRQPLSMRVGTRDDLRSFHELHCSSAGRQRFTPISLGYLESLWDELHPEDRVAVLLVDTDGKDLAGLVLTRFADVVTERLSGIATERLPRRMHLYEAVIWAALGWTRQSGARWYDQGGIGRPEALALAAGASRSSAEVVGSEWAHKLPLGGTPIVYPEPLELVANPIVRAGHRALRRWGPGRRLQERVKVRWRAPFRRGGGVA